MSAIIHDFPEIERRRRDIFGKDWIVPKPKDAPAAKCARCLDVGWVITEKGGRVECATCHNPQGLRNPDAKCNRCEDVGWVRVSAGLPLTECVVCGNRYRKPKP